MFISKRAKVVSDKPAYQEKEKTDSGFVWRYSPEHIKKRWQEKKSKLSRLEKNIEKLRKQYEKDLTADDLRVRAESSIVAIIDDTAARIGNEDSVKEYNTYGVSTLKVKHLAIKGNKAIFKFVGKDQVNQNIETSNSKTIKVLKELIKGKKGNDFIFEIDGVKIWDRAVNRYLSKFNISAKDLRGFQANRLMKDILKKKDWKDALEEVADIVGHEPATLKNQYLDPDLVEKYEVKKKAYLSVRAKLLPADELWLQSLELKIPGGLSVQKTLTPISLDQRQSAGISKNVKLNTLTHDAWRMLEPFLPSGAKMTSGFRTSEDQKRIIYNLWFKAGLNERDQGFGDYMLAMPSKLRELGYSVSSPVTESPYTHLKGNSFDISGANLDEISRSVAKASNSGLPIKLIPVIEEINNCVHVNIHYAKYDAVALQNVLNNGIRRASISIRAVPIDPQAWKSDPSPHRLLRHQDSIMSPFGGQKITQKQDINTLQYLYFGVHTTDDKKLAMTYANDGASPTDPPVVFELETGGMKPHADVDAMEFVSTINTMYSDAVKNFDEMLKSKIEMYDELQKSLPSGDFSDKFVEEVRRELENQAESGYFDETPSDVSGLISDQARRNNLTALSDFYVDDKKFMEALSDILQRGQVAQEFAAYVTNQYRYLEEIPDVRIIAAYTFKQFDFGELHADYEPDEGGEKEDETKPVKITYDDIDYNQIFQSVEFKEIWRNPNPIHLENSRTQYHGTTMSRAKQILAATNFGKMASKISKCAEEDNPHGVGTEMGFGKDDMPGDWFEKSPMFVNRIDIPEYDINDTSEQEARIMVKEDPSKFFYRGLHKTFPILEAEALRNLIETNAKFFFIFKYFEREEGEFKNMLEYAAELLSRQDVRAFFYYHLHHNFPELGRGAIIQLIDTNPDSFFDLGLQKDYPDFEESANAARNIKDPNKVELEQPEWIRDAPEQPISIRDKNASVNLDLSKKELEKIYEFEYKLHILHQQGYMDRRIEIAHEQQAGLLNKAISAFKIAFETWLSKYDRYFKENYKNMIQNLKDTPSFENMPEELLYDVVKDKTYRDHKYYPTIKKIYDDLASGATGNIDRDMVLFQRALHTAHHTGRMIEFIPGFEESGITKELLDNLSSGEKYIPRWDKDVKRFAEELGRELVKVSMFDDNISKYYGIPHAAIEILKTLPGKIDINDKVVTGEMQISKDPEIVVGWYLIDNSQYAETSAEKYEAAITVIKRYNPGYSERKTIYNCKDSDALVIARDIKSELEDPEFMNGVINSVVSVIEEKQREQEAFKRLNNLNLKKKISKWAVEPVPQIILTEEEKRIFDLLNEVKNYYKLPIELRAAGGFLRDKLLEAGIRNKIK